MPRNTPNRKKPGTNSLVRLNKFIADSGYCSRRKADQLIEDGKVIINGKKVFEMGVKVDPSADRVTVSGTPLKQITNMLYFILNKPPSIVTTMNDPEERPSIEKFITVHERLFPVGRLDWESEGLLLLTNDGDFSQRVSHPKEGIAKTYLVKVSGSPTEVKLNKLRQGVTIQGGGKVAAKYIEKIERPKTSKHDWYKVIITEGKNRQIRKMFEKIDCDVLKLQRTAIGQLRLGALKRGEMKALAPKDLEKIFASFDYDLVGKGNKTAVKKTKIKRKPSLKKLSTQKTRKKPTK